MEYKSKFVSPMQNKKIVWRTIFAKFKDFVVHKKIIRSDKKLRHLEKNMIKYLKLQKIRNNT